MTDQEPFASSHAPASQRPSVDRLRILDLLIWTACIALCLGWLHWMQRLEVFRQLNELQGLWAYQAAVSGTALTALFVVLPWRARRRGVAISPGEWLWWLLAVETLLDRLVAMAYAVALRQVGSNLEDSAFSRISPVVSCYLLASAAISAALAVGYLKMLEWHSSAPSGWRTIFRWCGVVMVIECAGAVLSALSTNAIFSLRLSYGSLSPVIYFVNVGGLRVGLLPRLLLTMAGDRHSLQPWCWRHWMGGVAFLGVATISVMWFVMRRA